VTFLGPGQLFALLGGGEVGDLAVVKPSKNERPTVGARSRFDLKRFRSRGNASPFRLDHGCTGKASGTTPRVRFGRCGVLFGIDCNGKRATSWMFARTPSLDEIADRAYEILLASVGRCLAAPVQQQA
jgi:hypothetical protein